MAFPDDPTDLEVGFAFGHSGAEDPTGLTYEPVTPDNGLNSVTIVRGRVGDAGSTEPTEMGLELNNTDGEFSPRNATGPRYGTLRNGTPMQVRVDVGSGLVVRGRGAVENWNPRWQGPEIADRVAVQARGTLSRLGRNLVSVSPLQRFVEHHRDVALGYWPLDDPVSSESGRALIGSQPMLVNTSKVVLDSGGLSTAVRPVWNGVELAPWLGTGVEMARFSTDLTVDSPELSAVIDSTGTEAEWAFDLVFRGNPSSAFPALVLGPARPGVGPYWLALEVINSSQIQVVAVNFNTGAFVEDYGTFSIPGAFINDQLHHFRVFATETGGGLFTWSIYLDGELVATDTSASLSLVPLEYVLIFAPGFSPADTKVVIGQAIAFGGTAGSIPSAPDTYAQVLGALGETAGDRVSRLCTEQGIAVDVAAGDTEAMGPQKDNNLLALLRECEDADEAVLVDRRDGRIGFDPRVTRYNIAPDLELTYEQLTDLVPFDDNRDLYNLITVSDPDRVNTATAEDTSSAVGTNELTGVGPRPLPQTRNLESVSQFADHASYLLNRGTVNEPRYVVVLDLFTNRDLIDAWLACDIGSRITITGAPTMHVGPDTLDLILEGYEETFSAVEWTVVLYLEPYSPYRVFEIADTASDANELAGRLAGDPDAAIRAAIDDNDTSIALDPNRFRWTTPYAGLFLPGAAGGNASTPDNAALDITGDIDIRVDATLSNATWFSASGLALISKYDSTVNQRAFRLYIENGLLRLGWSTNGTAVNANSPDTAHVPAADGRLAVRVTMDVDDGAGNRVIRFYTAPTMSGTWTQLGSTITTAGTTSIFNSSASVIVGADGPSGSGSLLIGTVHAAEVRNGIAGTIVANPDFEAQTPGTTSFADAAGRTWTVNSTAAITGDAFPFRARLGGEVVTVSDISTTPATFVAAGAASHVDNAAVTPALYTGHTADDWICVLARIRGTAGSLATPTDYELVKQVGKLYLFVKEHDGSESNPTVTPSGGAAGDTVSAFTFGLRGMSVTLAELADAIVTSDPWSNASAQNIAYGGVYPWQQQGCVLLLLAGKSDDWTSVAVPSGWTEIAEPSSTTGSDQGLYGAYQIQTMPAVAVEGSLVVTGGGAAVSESMVLALAGGYQTMTVSRSTNGVAKAQTRGTLIEVEQAYVLGL